ncbi:MAG TPA: BON domain-containing protein, partial [Nitrospiraceae bacterium]|nr:BON domain-containing protein [Nitrospiraceae bacterium]
MKTRFLITLCTAMVVGATLIAAPAIAVEKADEKTPINDAWLTSKTKIALFADARVKGRQINVEAKDGLVMIRGKVDSDEAKKAAEEIAKLVDGVKSVKN